MWAPAGQRRCRRYARGRLMPTSGRRILGSIRRAQTSSCVGPVGYPFAALARLSRAGPMRSTWECINDEI